MQKLIGWSSGTGRNWAVALNLISIIFASFLSCDQSGHRLIYLRRFWIESISIWRPIKNKTTDKEERMKFRSGKNKIADRFEWGKCNISKDFQITASAIHFVDNVFACECARWIGWLRARAHSKSSAKPFRTYIHFYFFVSSLFFRSTDEYHSEFVERTNEKTTHQSFVMSDDAHKNA